MSVQEVSWVERHRPTTFDDIIGHDPIIDRLEEWVDSPEIPHILLAGPAGTGKTTLVTTFAREKYGLDGWKNNLLDMNASDDRGIDAVRERVKSFARSATVGDHSYSIVFLDEVDSMTNDAQAALRRIMEDYSDQTRFFLSCNYQNQIIDPIQSRCAPFQMSGLDDEEIEDLLRLIAVEEGIDIADQKALDLIVNDCRGDARRAITRLQTAAVDGELRVENAEYYVDIVDQELVREILAEAAGGELDSAMEKLDRKILKEGVSPQRFLDSALWVVKTMDDLPNDSKSKIIDSMGEVDRGMTHGANPNIQLHSLLAKMMVSRHLSLPNYNDQ